MPGLFIGADHRGFGKKQKLLALLGKIENLGFEVFDLGAYTLMPEDDYNDIAITVAKSILRNPRSFGVLLCGSGIGVSIQANRIKGVRAILGLNSEVVKMGREHNDGNILCLPADKLTAEEMEKLVRQFIETKFPGEARHARRNHRLDEEIAL